MHDILSLSSIPCHTVLHCQRNPAGILERYSQTTFIFLYLDLSISRNFVYLNLLFIYLAGTHIGTHPSSWAHSALLHVTDHTLNLSLLLSNGLIASSSHVTTAPTLYAACDAVNVASFIALSFRFSNLIFMTLCPWWYSHDCQSPSIPKACQPYKLQYRLFFDVVIGKYKSFDVVTNPTQTTPSHHAFSFAWGDLLHFHSDYFHCHISL